MKTRKLSNRIGRTRRSCLLAVLVTSTITTAPALFGGDPGDRQVRRPQRLPSVHATETSDAAGTAEGQATAKEAGLDLVKYSVRSRSQPLASQITPAMSQSDAMPEVVRNAAGQDKSNAQTEIATVAARQTVAATRWLRSSTSTSASEVARRLLHQASVEYNVGAWLSAETTAWDALRWAAEGVDMEVRENGQSANNPADGALTRLKIAKSAIYEARDFAGKYGELDADAISRMARSHRTDVLDDQPLVGLTETDASDRYLDEARVALAAIAAQSIEAAQTMDLLAAIFLSRAEPKTLPSGTALCLRRAALQGQPENASLASRLGMHLADVGLFEEARWVLEHSLSIAPDQETTDALARVLRRTGHSEDAAHLIAAMQDRAHAGLVAQTDGQSESRPKIPEIVQLSPEEFAALSQPVIPLSRKSNSPTNASPASDRNASIHASLASNRANVASVQQPSVDQSELPASLAEDQPDPSLSKVVESPGDEKGPGIVRRFMNSFRSVW